MRRQNYWLCKTTLSERNFIAWNVKAAKQALGVNGFLTLHDFHYTKSRVKCFFTHYTIKSTSCLSALDHVKGSHFILWLSFYRNRMNFYKLQGSASCVVWPWPVSYWIGSRLLNHLKWLKSDWDHLCLVLASSSMWGTEWGIECSV